MDLTEKALRERGIRRNREQIEDDARRFASEVISFLPTGRWVTEPAREFSPAEVAVLEEGGLDLSPPVAEEPDPLARTAAKYAALLATALTTREAAGLLGTGESRVRQRLKEKTLYGVKAGRENRLPAFQFEGGREVPGIAEVLRHVDRSLHPVALSNWFTLPNPDLYLDEEEERAVSPREWLLSGGTPAVLVPLAEDL
ncbi:MAG: DNA-binding protein [Actinomycetota bacterium]|nr:DNA-binding protein [Actinomycetota bacterium]